MKFGKLSVEDSEGSYLAHSIMADSKRLKKGLKLSRDDVAQLLQAGVEHVVVASIEEGDLHEDAAATLVAAKVSGDGVTCGAAFTGRVNITADQDGVAVIDRTKVEALNSIDEAITLATVQEHAMVAKGQLVATSKIIPLAAPGKAIEVLSATDFRGAVSLAPYVGMKCSLIQTELPTVKASVYDKSHEILAARIKDFHGILDTEIRCAHDEGALAKLLLNRKDSDVILIMGASAITDRRDVIPAAIEQAGGHILHFGMPVDPGNLLLVAKIGETWVLGLPGCARSPKLNGIDHVLSRLCAGLNIRSSDIMKMGVGGLLSEYIGRPQPRTEKQVQHTQHPKVCIAVLAAGRSSRMGEKNKLLLPYNSATVLDHVLSEVKACEVAQSFIVTGHDREAIEAIAGKHSCDHIHNPAFADGMSSSVRTAISNVADDCEAILFVLGDMPGISRKVLSQIIDAYNPVEGRNLIVPTHSGKWGNPILWGREYFSGFKKLTGDKGARKLLSKHQQDIYEIEVNTDGIFLDIDTAEAYREFIERANTD